MFSLQSFVSDDPIKKPIELSGVGVRYGEKEITPDRIIFSYDQNYDPRFFADFPMESYSLAHEDHKIEFSNIEISDEFLQIKSTIDFTGKWSAVFSPKKEPFLWGSPSPVDKANFIVLNGPDIFFTNRNLEWELGGFCYEYSLFSEARGFLKEPRLSEKQILATGVVIPPESKGMRK